MEEILLIYVPRITPRINYIFSLFFDSLIITPFRITQSTEEYKTHIGPKFCYSQQVTETGGLFFAAAGLLFETGIHTQSINVAEWNGIKIFYKVNNGALLFDIFAASFYLVSRYEEYLDGAPDKHKRFRAQDSLALKNQFIDKPLINLWAEALKDILLEKFPGLKVTENTYKFIPTIDIDTAYAHLGRSARITIGSYLLALSRFRLAFIADKTLTLLGLRKDRYDTYDYQETVFKKYNVRPLYFFLVAKRSKYDKNISTGTRRFVGLVERLAKFSDIGIHPSYRSYSRPEIVAEEVKRLEKHLQNKVSKSRQHFLRIRLPQTYRCLAELNIADDYSFAYASCPGFRASICTPFFFYDLQAEAALPVKVHSTVVMEGTLEEYMRLNPEDAMIIIQKLITEVKKCKGEFINIWHNHSLEETNRWKAWRRVFEYMTEKAI